MTVKQDTHAYKLQWISAVHQQLQVGVETSNIIRITLITESSDLKSTDKLTRNNYYTTHSLIFVPHISTASRISERFRVPLRRRRNCGQSVRFRNRHLRCT